MSAHKQCPFCGHDNLEHAVYCFNCGNTLHPAPASEDSQAHVLRRNQRIIQAVLLPTPADGADDDPETLLPGSEELDSLQFQQPLTCLNCSTLNQPDANYCIQCGAALIVPDTHANLLAHASARTDIGRVRENNEDSVGLWALNGVVLALVADGMGGAVAGEEASRLTVEAVQADFVGQERGSPELLTLAEEVISDKLAAAIQAANQAVIDRVDENTALRGMGTTATLVFVRGSRALLAHVGDSRAYLVDGEQGWISQITSDHSFVEALLAAGHITDEQARNHPMKNVLYRALGQTPDTTADVYDRFLKGGDRIVLCSDGLTRHLTPDEIAQLVLLDDDPHAATQRLIDLANERGGEDNISAIVILMEDVPGDLLDGDVTQASPARQPSTDPGPSLARSKGVETLILQVVDDLPDMMPPPVVTGTDDAAPLLEPLQPPPDLPEPIPTVPSDSEDTLRSVPTGYEDLLQQVEGVARTAAARQESTPPTSGDAPDPPNEPDADETAEDTDLPPAQS
ncbi:MAG: Stp1/IreP family PP2C-type Ser/Thr phosphatase [Anaerolineae bacterium]|nr:Stp1/IreP family PP2C-type Ser/Thr phosphatase [Anaerolineae bacterium]